MKASRVWRRCSLVVAGVPLAAGCLLVGQVLAQTGKVARAAGESRPAGKGVRIPLEYDDEGRAKSEVYAERTMLPDAEGEIRAEKVRMVLMEEATDTKATVVTSDSCKVSPSNKTARSNSPVRLEQTGLVMTGTGFRWNAAREHIRIMQDARVVISRSFVEQREGRSAAPTALPGFRGVGY